MVVFYAKGEGEGPLCISTSSIRARELRVYARTEWRMHYERSLIAESNNFDSIHLVYNGLPITRFRSCSSVSNFLKTFHHLRQHFCVNSSYVAFFFLKYRKLMRRIIRIPSENENQFLSSSLHIFRWHNFSATCNTKCNISRNCVQFMLMKKPHGQFKRARDETVTLYRYK